MPAPTSKPTSPPAVAPAAPPARAPASGPAITSPMPGIVSDAAAAAIPTRVAPTAPPTAPPTPAPSSALLPMFVFSPPFVNRRLRVSSDMRTWISSLLYPRAAMALYAFSADSRSRNELVMIGCCTSICLSDIRHLHNGMIPNTLFSRFGTVRTRDTESEYRTHLHPQARGQRRISEGTGTNP